MDFSLTSYLHPPKQKDFSKWSTWLPVARDLALDYNVRRAPREAWRKLFDKGLTPEEAARSIQDEVALNNNR